jgi:hypothetical protein
MAPDVPRPVGVGSARLCSPNAQREVNEKPQLVRLGLKLKEHHSNYRGRGFFRRSGLVFFRIGCFDPSAAVPSRPRTRVLFAMSASLQPRDHTHTDGVRASDLPQRLAVAAAR